MEIKVKDKNLGSCTIETINDIDKAEEYTIKALACMQIMCMSDDPDKLRRKKMIDILADAIHKCDELYTEEVGDIIDPAEQF